MKTYGMFFADNGSPWDFCGFEDPRWNTTELKEFSRVIGADFEVVDESSLMVNVNSGQAAVKSATNSMPSSWVNAISKASNKCLGILGGGAGAPAVQSTCLNGTNQELLFSQVTGGYKITVRNSNDKLVVKGGNTALGNGVPIVQAYFNGYPSEIWNVTQASDGTFSMMVHSSGKCLGVGGVATQEGAPVEQLTCAGTPNQKWSFEPAF